MLTEGVRVNPGAGMCFVEVFLKGSEVRLCLSADATMSKQKRTLLTCHRVEPNGLGQKGGNINHSSPIQI